MCQPNNGFFCLIPTEKWPSKEILHPAHAGAAPDPHHGAGNPEQRHYEHPARIPGK